MKNSVVYVINKMDRDPCEHAKTGKMTSLQMFLEI